MSVELTIETVEETIVLELQDHVPAVLTIDHIPELRDELDSKVDKVEGYSLVADDEIDKLSTVEQYATANRPDAQNADKIHEHVIADVAGLDDALAGKVDAEAGMGLSELSFTTVDKLSLDQSEQDRHTHNNKPVIDGLSDDAGVLQYKGLPISDQAALDAKVDKVAGKSLVSDTEIAKLLTVQENATANRADSENADKIHGHTISDVTGLITRLNDIEAVLTAINGELNHLMPWNPSALFMSGESGVWCKPSIMRTLFQNSSGETPVVSIGDPVGLMLDKSGNDNNATQAASSFRPTYTLDPSGAPVLLGDGVDDALITPPATYSGTSYINTSYGWYKSSVQEGVAASLPLTWLREYVAREGAASVADDDRMRSYFATEQKLMIVMTRNLVINNLRMYSGGSETTVVAIGNNGITAEIQLSSSTDQIWDLSAEGLTAPALLVFDSNTALVNFRFYSNQLTGSIPDLSSNTALVNFLFYSNQLTGSIPDLSSNTALTQFYCQFNQLTGSIPDLSSNTALTQFYCQSNQLTGSIPDLSSNTALTIFRCGFNQLTGSIPDLSSNTSLTYFTFHGNQLTGWSGGSVSNTIGTFSAQNNLLTQTAVDGLLVAFDAAGRATGTLNLGGTTNSTPSATGKTAADNLRAKGWAVTLNGY